MLALVVLDLGSDTNDLDVELEVLALSVVIP